jgi:amidohydrolase
VSDDAPALPPGFEDGLATWLDAHRDELVTFRRHLHANPELSGEEVETTAFVAERLLVGGLQPRVLPDGIGLICDLAPDAPGPTVALRADLDALAMDDGKDVPYRSKRPGVAHACGHDVHTTVVLGAGLALHELLVRRGEPAAVRLVFQHAEERVPGGAIEVIAAGGLDGVDRIFGLHCDPRLPAGLVGLTDGAITSATDMIAIRLSGPGGHTARPERTVDLVRLAGEVAVALPALVQARLGDLPARRPSAPSTPAMHQTSSRRGRSSTAPCAHPTSPRGPASSRRSPRRWPRSSNRAVGHGHSTTRAVIHPS